MRWLAGEHLICHGAQRIDVAATIDDAITCSLLGTHVLRCAERESGLRDSIAACFADCQRDTEIRDYRMTRLKQNVFRLQVAMDYSVRVRIVASRRGTPARRRSGSRGACTWTSALEPPWCRASPESNNGSRFGC